MYPQRGDSIFFRNLKNRQKLLRHISEVRCLISVTLYLLTYLLTHSMEQSPS